MQIPELPPELIADIQKVALYISGAFLIMWLLFANTVRTALLSIRQENRAILPSQAWFLAVPLFNMYWNFEVVRRLAISFNNEFYDRKVAVEDMPTRKAGAIYAWAFLIYWFPMFPLFIRVVAMVVFMIYFVIYWIQIVQYKNLILEHEKWKQKGES